MLSLGNGGAENWQWYIMSNSILAGFYCRTPRTCVRFANPFLPLYYLIDYIPLYSSFYKISLYKIPQYHLVGQIPPYSPVAKIPLYSWQCCDESILIHVISSCDLIVNCQDRILDRAGTCFSPHSQLGVISWGLNTVYVHLWEHYGLLCLWLRSSFLFL